MLTYLLDERKWDGFISYKCTCPDEDYVLSILYPKLANVMQYNINMHHKDFLPGDGMYFFLFEIILKTLCTFIKFIHKDLWQKDKHFIRRMQ